MLYIVYELKKQIKKYNQDVMNNKIGNNFKKISMLCNFLARKLFLQAQPHCRPRRDIKL